MKLFHDFDQDYYDAIVTNKRKLIAWGSGSIFEYYYRYFPLRISYILDNDSKKWGSVIDGIKVRSPDCLFAENKDDIVILIYSSFIEAIQKQIKVLGNYESMYIGELVGYIESKEKWKKIEECISNRSKRRRPKSKNAVVIQGPILNLKHLAVVMYHGYKFGEDYVILSTWENTDEGYLKKVEGIVDEFVLNPLPAYAGYQNRNLQIISTYQGLKRAKSLRVENALKVRTDTALIEEKIFEKLEFWREEEGAFEANKMGLKGRILVTDIYTRKNLLYHASDIIMYGCVDDMLLFWKEKLDLKEYDFLRDFNKFRSNYDLSINMFSTECYLGRNFCDELGWEKRDTLEDSWRYYRDLFRVIDHEDIGLFWIKNPCLKEELINSEPHACLTSNFWKELMNRWNSHEMEARKVDLKKVYWDKFYVNE